MPKIPISALANVPPAGKARKLPQGTKKAASRTGGSDLDGLHWIVSIVMVSSKAGAGEEPGEWWALLYLKKHQCS
jgi:hypothetical protein